MIPTKFTLRLNMLLLLIFASFSTVLAQDVTRTQSIQVECGNIIESEFVNSFEEDLYQISMDAGNTLNVSAVSLGGQLKTGIILTGPTNLGIASSFQRLEEGRRVIFGNSSHLRTEAVVNSDILSARGTHNIRVVNFVSRYYEFETDRYDPSAIDPVSGGIGVYTLFIGCTLRDGTVINPGDALPEAVPDPIVSSQSAFPGFGFPGLNSVDFSSGIEIPIQLGQAQTIPVGGDISLYTYESNTEESRTLTLSRLSGNISIGVTVINRDTNEIIFFAGLPSSDNLSAELTFPSAGTYVIGLFRVDTADRIGTSGAVQITLE